MTPQRTTALGYKPENIRQDYTGYQKDDESGLEYAQARYYNTSHGRFTSVDPLTASANIKNPQTFNRYSYGLNSPYKFTDPLGLMSVNSIACGTTCSNSGPISGGSDIIGNDGSFSRAIFRKQTQKEGAGPREASPNEQYGNHLTENLQPSTAPPAPSPFGGSFAKDAKFKSTLLEPDSADAKISGQNKALAELLTNGGIARTNRAGAETFIGGFPSHFRYEDGQIFAVHVYGDEHGAVSGNVYIPSGFTATYNGGTYNTVSAYNSKTKDFIIFLHLKGVNSQKQLDRNMRTKNSVGSRLMGQTGGPGGNGHNYIHSCIKIFKGYEGYKIYDKAYNQGAVDRKAWSDLRTYIK